MNRSTLRHVCLAGAVLTILVLSLSHRAAAEDVRSTTPDRPAVTAVEKASAATQVVQPAAQPDATATRTAQAEQAAPGDDVWSPDTSPTQMACGDRRCSGSLQCCWYQRCRSGRCVAW